MIQITAERVQLAGPELLVVRDPLRRTLQPLGPQRALHDAALLRALDQPGLLEDAQVLHESGQRHVVRGGELADRPAVVRELGDHRAARPVGERGEEGVEVVVRILNH